MNKYEVVSHAATRRGDTLAVFNLKTGEFLEDLRVEYVSIFDGLGIAFSNKDGEGFTLDKTSGDAVVLLRKSVSASDGNWPPQDGDVWKHNGSGNECHVANDEIRSSQTGHVMPIKWLTDSPKSHTLVHRKGHKLGSK